MKLSYLLYLRDYLSKVDLELKRPGLKVSPVNQVLRILLKTKFVYVVRFPVLSRKGYKKPQELQGPKYMPYLSVADIRISLLFKEMLYSVLKQLIRSFEKLWTLQWPAIWIEFSRAFPFVFTY